MMIIKVTVTDGNFSYKQLAYWQICIMKYKQQTGTDKLWYLKENK